MSATQAAPPPRAIANTGWKRHGRVLVIILGVGGVLIVASMLWSGGPRQQKEKLISAASIPATYTAAVTPPVVRTEDARPAASEQPQRQPPAAQPKPAPPPPPQMSVTYFRRADGQLPEYMKPKAPPPAAHVAAAEPASNIAYKAEDIEGAQAFVLQHPEAVLPEGTQLFCKTETAVITGVSGVNPFRCRLWRDAVSTTGNVLMEAGTVVYGTYQSVVAEGQARIVAVTAHARTPYGIIVPLGGPIADPTGAAGVEGTVDNHWMQRIGGALILSLLDAATSLGQNALQGNGNGNQTLNFGSSFGQGGPFSQVGQSLLEHQMSIPPTISLKQGSIVSLWVTKFVDFSKVYHWEASR